MSYLKITCTSKKIQGRCSFLIIARSNYTEIEVCHEICQPELNSDILPRANVYADTAFVKTSIHRTKIIRIFERAYTSYFIYSRTKRTI